MKRVSFHTKLMLMMAMCLFATWQANVYDMAGRLVQQATAGGGEVVIDDMAPGVYIVNGQKVIVK